MQGEEREGTGAGRRRVVGHGPGQDLTPALLPSPGPGGFPGQTGEEPPTMGPSFLARFGCSSPRLPCASPFLCQDVQAPQ